MYSFNEEEDEDRAIETGRFCCCCHGAACCCSVKSGAFGAQMSTYFCLHRAHQFGRRSFNVVRITFAFTLLIECGYMWPRPPLKGGLEE